MFGQIGASRIADTSIVAVTVVEYPTNRTRSMSWLATLRLYCSGLERKCASPETLFSYSETVCAVREPQRIVTVQRSLMSLVGRSLNHASSSVPFS